MLTGVCHVQKCAGCIALNSHVLRLRKTGQGDQGTRLGNLRLIVIYTDDMSRETIKRVVADLPWVARLVTHPTALH